MLVMSRVSEGAELMAARELLADDARSLDLELDLAAVRGRCDPPA